MLDRHGMDPPDKPEDDERERRRVNRKYRVLILVLREIRHPRAEQERS